MTGRTPWDARTLCLAAGAWVGAAGGWLLPVGAALVGAAGAVAAALLVRRRRGHIALAAVALATGAVAAAAASSAREPPAALVGATAEYVVGLSGEPRQLAAQPGRDQARRLLAGTVEQARIGSRQWRLDFPVRVMVAESDWQGCRCQVGARIRFHGTLRSRDRFDTASFLSAATAPQPVAGGSGADAVAARVRADLRALVREADTDAASLVSGLALGDESEQRPPFAQAMRDAGLAHLTAVSGGNILIILVVVLVALRSLRFGVAAQVAGCAAAVAGYVVLVGPQPSVLRAALMAGAGLAGVVAGGPARGTPVLFGCTYLLLVAAPELALSLGFALSVAATAGLVVLAPPLARRLRRRMPAGVALPLAVTVAAQLAATPVLLAVGSPVSWVSVPANLVVAPAVAPVTVLGLVAALTAPVAGPVAAGAAGAAAALARLVAVTAYAAQTAAASRQLATAVLAVATLAVAIGAVVLARRWWPDRWRLPAAALVAAAVTLAALTPWRGGRVPTDWRTIACDVGQGTAVLLRTDPGAVLVDTGPAGGGVAECLHAAGVERLDVLVLTHFHADHVGDVATVLAQTAVGTVLVGPSPYPREGAAAVQQLAAAAQVPAVTVAAGDSVPLAGTTLYVLWPRPGYQGSPDAVNDSSLVVLARWADGGSVLLPGDVEPPAQEGVMAAWQPPAADVTVVPHHGSDHQEPGFAQWTGSVAAVASVGAGNSYGHPAQGTLAEYAARGAAVARTDVDGTVAYSWRDGGVVVTTVG